MEIIHIISTSGTIEGLDKDLNEEESPNSKVSIKDFLEAANIYSPFRIEEVFRKDSRAITADDRKILATKIKSTKATKILITHGTYTMEETARYMGKLNLKKTIVLVGSFILGSLENTDAPFNLGYAISSLQFLKPDVYIAMNGQIFHWENVSKNLDTNKFERNE